MEDITCRMLKTNDGFFYKRNRGKQMYRMMIADDEDGERIGIQYLLNKLGFEFNIIEAEDGKEALKKLEECAVDILMTDVRMPFIDGLELSEIVRNRYPDTEIIFFSGYDDFSYVKQALSIQAVDYILKPVNPEEFKKVIDLVIARIERKKKDELHDQQLKKVLAPYIITRLLSQIPYEKFRNTYRESELDFLNQYKRMILLEFEEDFFGKTVEDIQDLNAKIAENGLILSCDMVDLNPAQGILLFTDEGKNSSYYRKVADEIHILIEKEYHVSCFLAVSDLIDAPDDIGSIYQKTEAYFEERFFNKDIFVYPIESGDRTKSVKSENVTRIFNEIEEDIKFCDVFSLKKNVEIILDKCRNNEFQSYIYTRFICGNLIKILYHALPEHQNEMADKIEELYRVNHFSEIEQSLLDLMGRVGRVLDSQQDSPKHMIAIIEKYIRDHYMEVLSLDVLAEKVFLTPHYLSSIFSQEKGIGLNKYIKKVRMDKAEQLLTTTNMKIGDICEAVGYTNLSYFCKTFRNEYGVTPEKYREK